MSPTLEITMIKPAEELGPVLTSRSLAEDLRARIEALTARGEAVVVDFEGVEAVSPSFADEIFAKLPNDLVESGQVKFENIAEDLQHLVDFVVAGRSRATS